MRSLTRRRTPSVTTTPMQTQIVTPKAKATAGSANSGTGLARLRKKADTVYNKTLNQAVTGGETAAKSGAAGVAGTVGVVADAYKDAAVTQAKMQAVDLLIEEIAPKVPVTGLKAILAKVPVLNKIVEARQKSVVKAVLVTIMPNILVGVSDYIESDRVAVGVLSVADTLVQIGARDGVKLGADILTPKVKELLDLFAPEAGTASA